MVDHYGLLGLSTGPTYRGCHVELRLLRYQRKLPRRDKLKEIYGKMKIYNYK